jgi:hypothetical protein
VGDLSVATRERAGSEITAGKVTTVITAQNSLLSLVSGVEARGKGKVLVRNLDLAKEAAITSVIRGGRVQLERIDSGKRESGRKV